MFNLLQIVCRVYTCFTDKCNQVKCPTDSLPYKPGAKVRVDVVYVKMVQ